MSTKAGAVMYLLARRVSSHRGPRLLPQLEDAALPSRAVVIFGVESFGVRML